MLHDLFVICLNGFFLISWPRFSGRFILKCLHTLLIIYHCVYLDFFKYRKQFRFQPCNYVQQIISGQNQSNKASTVQLSKTGSLSHTVHINVCDKHV